MTCYTLAVLLALTVVAIAGDVVQNELGCFIDGVVPDLDGFSMNNDKVNPERCVSICRQLGFRYAGVQTGLQCNCGHTYGKYGADVSPEACSTVCLGDQTQMCGGTMRNFVYDLGGGDSGGDEEDDAELPAAQPSGGGGEDDEALPAGGASDGGGADDEESPAGREELGCFIDGEERDLDGFVIGNDKINPERCADVCRQTGFRYAGVQTGYQCYCGHTYGRYGADVSPDACSTVCLGDSSQNCGGTMRNYVYDLGDGASDGGGADDEELPADCREYGRYNCGRRNPCNPQCVEGQEHYLGNTRDMYVTCGEDNGCTENTCPGDQIWYQSLGRCDSKSLWGVTAEMFTGANAATRCDKDKFDCRERNPCAPQRCVGEQHKYPGTGRLRFIQCQGRTCEEVKCPRGSPFNAERQECVSIRA